MLNYINAGSTVAGIGLVGLSLYQFSKGDIAGGVQSLFAALAAFGLRAQNELHNQLTAKLNRKGML